MCLKSVLVELKFFITIFCFLAEFVYVQSTRDYLINTPNCKVPNYEPFNEEVLDLWYPQYYKSCSTKPLLTFVTKTNRSAILHVREHLFPLYGGNVTCCLSNVIREMKLPYPDNNIRFSECLTFKNRIQIVSETVLVRCRNNLGYQVYKNIHTVILKEKIEDKMKLFPSHRRSISVLLVVIDSVSRLNLIRTMPSTYNYLMKNDFIEMKGYNKIGENTLPNFLALLTGFNTTEAARFRCLGSRVNDLDNCPMLWYTFGGLGYATAYGEDWGSLNTFNYNRKGFTKPPTDYYFRPYVLASEMIGTLHLHGAPYCAGPESSGERQLSLALDFANTFKELPYFGIFWMNTFSHQAMNTPLRFDTIIRSFFTELKSEGILNDSIVVFLSDHGIRLAPKMKKTLSGWFEERLPMNYISLPKWFQKQYPKYYENLKLNSNKLTSTYDMHMTLQHILKLSIPNYQISSCRSCPKCISLLEEVPHRSCVEAGIPETWCTCMGYLIPLNVTSVLATDAAQFALKFMQSKLILSNFSHLCNDLNLFRVHKAGSSEFFDYNNEKYLVLNFFTASAAEFAVTLKYTLNYLNETIFRNILSITRIDGTKATCVNYSEISEYCSCRKKNIISPRSQRVT